MSTCYIPHHATNPVLVPSYYHPVYTSESLQYLHHYPINQQQQLVYVMPFPQKHSYDMSVQPNLADNYSALASGRPPPSPSPTTVQASGYKDMATVPPSIYSTKTATQMKPQMAYTALYSSYITPAPPPLIPIQSNQYQQQHHWISPQPHLWPSLPLFNYSHAAHGQGYYFQHPVPP